MVKIIILKTPVHPFALGNSISPGTLNLVCVPTLVGPSPSQSNHHAEFCFNHFLCFSL